ncbi:hypothetical protein BMS3Abin04_01628 [bacterium BMS3Abin04]|nr:hypothetical protein BMS3Abin04_01628 [bacterium BMS3Abin04]
MQNSISIVQIIQAMLAPGLMISGCGLLLLGINNKYSLIVNRIRLLNQEKRRLAAKSGIKDLGYDEEVRLESIVMQMQKLLYRVRLVRDIVISYSIAVAFFVLASIFIGVEFLAKDVNMQSLALVFFVLGVFLVLVGILLAAFETKKGYDIVKIEVKAEE